MILVTGASGKTGNAIIQALVSNSKPVRALVRRESQIKEMQSLGVQQTVVGDMRNPTDLLIAYADVQAVYHICSNMNPDEVSIGQKAIEAAQRTGVQHFVYHSVFHPQVQSMPHHWNKLQVEALLFESGLNYTILQPVAYMQNVLGYWPKMMHDGIYAVPYSSHCRFSLVDLSDVAQVAARVLTETSKHVYAIYELCGHQVLTNSDIARLAGNAIGREVRAVALDRHEWEKEVRAVGMSEYAVNTLLDMFEYYDKFGFTGNANTLTWLLNRLPTSFEEFLQRSTPIPPSP